MSVSDETTNNPIINKQAACIINDTHTEILVTGFSDKIFVVITQYGKIGSLVSAWSAWQEVRTRVLNRHEIDPHDCWCSSSSCKQSVRSTYDITLFVWWINRTSERIIHALRDIHCASHHCHEPTWKETCIAWNCFKTVGWCDRTAKSIWQSNG